MLPSKRTNHSKSCPVLCTKLVLVLSRVHTFRYKAQKVQQSRLKSKHLPGLTDTTPQNETAILVGTETTITQQAATPQPIIPPVCEDFGPVRKECLGEGFMEWIDLFHHKKEYCMVVETYRLRSSG
jgi:hypothetical protein